jgi:hypothetical protein
MLGHEDVTEEIEAVALASLFEDFEEDCAGVVVVEEGKPMVATEGDEVIVTEGVVSLEVARHAELDGDYPTHRDDTAMNGAPTPTVVVRTHCGC